MSGLEEESVSEEEKEEEEKMEEDEGLDLIDEEMV